MIDPQALVQSRLTHNSWGLLGSQGYVLGLDVGSYGLRAGLVDLHSHTYTSVQADADLQEAEATLEKIISLTSGLLEQHHVNIDRLVRIGVGFPGPVDSREGLTLLSPRVPGWERFPMCERLEDAFGAAALLDNDANLIALAEATFGVGRDVQHLVYVHLSSGVGGGLVLDGRLYHGATSTAGEIGHAVIGPRDAARPDARPATLEERVSIRGLMRRAAELGLHTKQLDDIFNDSRGQQVVNEAADVLGMRLAQITALLDPQMIVLGGVVTRYGGDAFINAVQQHMNEYTGEFVKRSVPVVAAVLGADSVVIGGVALALESMST